MYGKSGQMALGNGFVALVAIVLCLEPSLTTNCPDTFVALNGSCYLFGYMNKLTFVQAEVFCDQHDAHLVHIDDATENEVIREYMHHLKDEAFWIGLTDETVEGVWEWHDTRTQANFTDWYPGEPNGNSGENCVEIYPARGWHWYDFTCNTRRDPICELRREQPEIVG